MVDQETEPHEDSAQQSRASSQTAYVVVVYGASAGAVHEIRDRGCTLGRPNDGSSPDIAIDDARMSRKHVRIEGSSTGWMLVDLGSKNGGFVDGIPFAPRAIVPLASGAVVRIGNTLLVFRTGAHHDDHDSERETFPGASPQAVEVRRRVGLVSRGSGHVLVLGETGTGKERVARRIGRTPPSRPFVAQNCAELTRDLARSELFGHVRGAFSGATNAKDGLADVVQDGVLFLDEVGELPLEVQGELLRFLEDGSYRPVGSTTARISQARVVAATNVDLDAAVRIGAFRRDLLARLRATNKPIVLPPLRERREDVLGWARRFLDDASPHELPPLLWSAGAAECLLLYGWPENLRELGGVMRGLIESPPSWPVPAEGLPGQIQQERRALRQHGEPIEAPMATIDDPAPEVIARALGEAGGRMRAASIALNIDRRKLYRLCERHGIDLAQFRK